MATRPRQPSRSTQPRTRRRTPAGAAPTPARWACPPAPARPWSRWAATSRGGAAAVPRARPRCPLPGRGPARSDPPGAWPGTAPRRSAASSGRSGTSRGAGGPLTTWVMIAGTVDASNARRAVSAKYSTAPSENTSLRPSTCVPDACSGDMYDGVPRKSPGAVSSPSLDLRDPEVHQLGLLGGRGQRAHDIGRLHVAVDDPALVGVVERARDAARDGQRAAPGQRAVVADDLGQRAALEVLEGDEQGVGPLVAAEVVHGDDRGVGEQGRPRGPRPGSGPRRRRGPRRPRRAEVDRLQRHRAAEDGVRGAVDHAHHPAADLALDRVASEHLGGAAHGALYSHRGGRWPKRSRFRAATTRATAARGRSTSSATSRRTRPRAARPARRRRRRRTRPASPPRARPRLRRRRSPRRRRATRPSSPGRARGTPRASASSRIPRRSGGS